MPSPPYPTREKFVRLKRDVIAALHMHKSLVPEGRKLVPLQEG